MVAINALRQSIEEKVGDHELRSELLKRIEELQRCLLEKQGQIEELTTRLTAASARGWRPSEPVYDYDPPV